MKKISIIMGTYNCEKTIDEAINSILAQTYRNWELIVCDDGSRDSTLSILKKYQLAYPNKIILIANESNKGLNFTLNKCLKKASGDYIARMDGDDLSLPERLEIECAFLDANPNCAIVSSPMIYFDADGDFKIGKVLEKPKPKDFVKGTPFCHAPCMVRKEAYTSVSGYTVSKKRLRVEDWDLWVRMYEKGFIGVNLKMPLYKMRDDRNAKLRRKFKYRINESRVIASAVKKLNLSPFYYVFCFRPIIVGLLPPFLYNYLHRKTK